MLIYRLLTGYFSPQIFEKLGWVFRTAEIALKIATFDAWNNRILTKCCTCNCLMQTLCCSKVETSTYSKYSIVYQLQQNRSLYQCRYSTRCLVKRILLFCLVTALMYQVHEVCWP